MKRSEIITYSLFGIGFLVLIGLIVWAVSAFKKDNSEKSLDEAKKEVKKSDLSFAESTYKAWAERLFVALKGMGTDTKTVFSIIEQLKTSSDWYQLVVAFGNPDDQSLTAWLQDDLSSSEMLRVQKHLRSINVTI